LSAWDKKDQYGQTVADALVKELGCITEKLENIDQTLERIYAALSKK